MDRTKGRGPSADRLRASDESERNVAEGQSSQSNSHAVASPPGATASVAGAMADPKSDLAQLCDILTDGLRSVSKNITDKLDSVSANIDTGLVNLHDRLNERFTVLAGAAGDHDAYSASDDPVYDSEEGDGLSTRSDDGTRWTSAPSPGPTGRKRRLDDSLSDISQTSGDKVGFFKKLRESTSLEELLGEPVDHELAEVVDRQFS